MICDISSPSGAVTLSLFLCVFLILSEQCIAFITSFDRPVGTSRLFDGSITDPGLFEGEEQEMLPICRNYVAAKYERSARQQGRQECNEQDVAELLRGLLPPVTPSELEKEVEKTLALILDNPKNSKECIDEESFVEAIVANSYWKKAGGLVVKE